MDTLNVCNTITPRHVGAAGNQTGLSIQGFSRGNVTDGGPDQHQLAACVNWPGGSIQASQSAFRLFRLQLEFNSTSCYNIA